MSEDLKFVGGVILVLIACVGGIAFLAVHSHKAIQADRERCERAGGIYLQLKSSDDVCLGGAYQIRLDGSDK